MAAIVWNDLSTRRFETGIDRGVFYPIDDCGVPWHGLTGIEENPSSSSEAVYFDGVKFNDIVTLGEYTATVKAITYPDEFMECEGILEDQSGVYIHDQPQGRFGMSYRTMEGDVTGAMPYYKIHLLWNLTAVPTTKVFDTISEDFNLTEFQWTIAAIPEDIEGYRPTAHIVLDSRKLDPWLLQDIEDIIYGDEEDCPRLPSLKDFTTFVRKWNRFIVTDNGDGTWTASTSRDDGVIVMTDDTTFLITTDTIEYIDPETYKIWSSEKNEEDING